MSADERPNPLPDKIYFKIGEVAEIVGVEPYVLRYWESEFPVLRPSKSRSQQRLYRKRDVEVLLRIKKLLYEDLYTIAGAKKALSRGQEKSSSPQLSLGLSEHASEAGAASIDAGIFKKLERELSDILKLLEAHK